MFTRGWDLKHFASTKNTTGFQDTNFHRKRSGEITNIWICCTSKDPTKIVEVQFRQINSHAYDGANFGSALLFLSKLIWNLIPGNKNMIHRIGFRENLNRKPPYLVGKKQWFPVKIFPYTKLLNHEKTHHQRPIQWVFPDSLTTGDPSSSDSYPVECSHPPKLPR